MDGDNDGASAQGAAQAGVQGDRMAAQAQAMGDAGDDDAAKAHADYEAALKNRGARGRNRGGVQDRRGRREASRGD